jgi:hypothetical protein
MLGISYKFSPIRLTAFMRNEVEMDVSVENRTKEPCWVEADVNVPKAISLAPDRELATGRLRIGIIKPNEILSKKVRIYGGASSYPELYQIRIIAFAFGKDGTITERAERKAELRCERIGGA